MARLENVPPSHLCIVEEGGGLKGKGSGIHPAHRDDHDIGRLQCVLALSDVGFDVWPFSHELPVNRGAVLGSGDFHLIKAFMQELKNHSERVVFSAKAGDVLILVGGLTVHGVPDIEENHPSPRVVTYATFWPPGTPQGIRHAKKQCACSQAGKVPIG